MKYISLIDALADCTDSCGWCVNHCDDNEKYAVLVNCIHIQKEFLTVSKTVYMMLGRYSVSFMNKILDLFVKLAFDVQKNNCAFNKPKVKANQIQNVKWELPGCSQMFVLAQSLERLYLDEAFDNE